MKKFILIALSCAFGLTAWSQSKSKFDIARESFQNEFIKAFNGDDTSKLYAMLMLITDAEVIAVVLTKPHRLLQRHSVAKVTFPTIGGGCRSYCRVVIFSSPG